MRRLEQPVPLGALHERLAQERLVGRVLEQAPDQIGHARQQLPVRAIQSDPARRLQERLPEGFRHAVEHLELVAVRRNLQGARDLDHRRHAADVVRRAGQVADVVVPEDRLGRPLEGCVRRGLDRVNRSRPPGLSGQDRLVIPVRTLDEPDGDGKPLAPRPFQEPVGVLFALPEIGLQRESQVGVAPEFGIAPQPAIEFDRDVLERAHLRVETEESANRDDLAVQGLEATEHSVHGPFEICWVRQGKQRRWFDGHVDARDVAPVENAPPPPSAFHECWACPRAASSLW